MFTLGIPHCYYSTASTIRQMKFFNNYYFIITWHDPALTPDPSPLFTCRRIGVENQFISIAKYGMGSPSAAYSWSTFFARLSWEHLGKLSSARQPVFSGCLFCFSLRCILASTFCPPISLCGCNRQRFQGILAISLCPPSSWSLMFFVLSIKARSPTSSRLVVGTYSLVVACWPGLTAVDAAATRIATSYLSFLAVPACG